MALPRALPLALPRFLSRIVQRRHFDLPLAHDPTARFLLLITAVMVYLAALALAGALVVSDMARRWDSGLAGGLTVQIVPLSGPGAVPVAERLEKVLAVLRGTPGIRSATALSADQVAHLLEPWLGREGAKDPLLPVPTLVDVTTGGPVDVAGLTAHLSTVPGVTIDDHAAWLADLRAFAGSVEMAAIGIVLLISAAAVMSVVFAVRAGLAIHRNVVELLHLMGAPDRYVARQFESHVLGLCLRGGACGLGLAALTLFGVSRAAGSLRASLLPDASLSPWQWAALALVPLTACALAMLTARWTVLRTLETMP
ncbi:cell division protein FtsX [Azospirillum sp. sgz301742]